PANQIKGYGGIKFANGYPVAGKKEKETNDDTPLKKGILGTLEEFDYDRYYLVGSGDEAGSTLTITPKTIDKTTKDDDGCVVVYTNPSEAGKPAIVQAFTGGC